MTQPVAAEGPLMGAAVTVLVATLKNIRPSFVCELFSRKNIRGGSCFFLQVNSIAPN
jgi:hypothetical protein